MGRKFLKTRTIFTYYVHVLYTFFIRQNGSKHKSNKSKSRACANNNHSWFQDI